jgi:glutamyl-tRNA reductase
MKLLITGVSYKTAPVELRECLAFREEAIEQALNELRSREGVDEALILSTCNRVELAISTDESCEPRRIADEFLTYRHPSNADELESHLYRFEGREAIHHLFRVASSLDSMILGEPQILGQLKKAYAVSKGCGAVHGTLDALVTRAFSVAKRVRSETGIGQMAVSVSYAAVELARKIFGTLSDRTIMIAGAGKMSELAARHLRRSGASDVLVTNRTYERAEDMAKRFDGKAVEYDQFLATLPKADILIASSAAPHYLLTREDMQKVIAARRNRPVFLIDIAVPRNIEPSVNEIDNVFLYDIDDLQGVVNSNLRERRKEADRAEEIVAAEVERTMARLKAAELTPTIVGLQEQLEQIRAGELERVRRKYGPFTPGQEEALEALTRGIVNKIAHGPISELRNHAGHPESAHVIAAFRKAFHLQD